MDIRGTGTRGSGARATVLTMVLVAATALAACSSSASDGAGSGGSTTTTKASAGESGAPAAEGEFRLLSYNVAGLPAEISKEHPDVNIPKISPLLNDYDVVMTQEDFDWWKPDGLASKADFTNYHDRLRADTTHEFQTEQHPGAEAVGIDIEADRPNMELGDGLGVLSRFPISDTERIPWDGCFGEFDSGASDCLAMKGFLVTRLELADGVEVDLYDLHGEAGGGPEDQALQAEDFEQLAAYIEEHSAGRAIILGGDTNLHTDPPGDDAHEDSADGEDVEIWNRFLEATGLTDACTATECDGPGRIDKVAYRSDDGIEFQAEHHEFETDVFVDEAGEALSDHEALEVVFTWKKE
ncbi:endonuclease/exonuclease/phosphatase family protein [Aquihabitans daechungensis]|uniref:endonuclease/exonuclease/phosphatase family protein n=1 Tax=Aquihabitans daechungensis TaxID=1052257 RepID=UPI003BA2A135